MPAPCGVRHCPRHVCSVLGRAHYCQTALQLFPIFCCAQCYVYCCCLPSTNSLSSIQPTYRRTAVQLALKGLGLRSVIDACVTVQV